MVITLAQFKELRFEITSSRIFNVLFDECEQICDADIVIPKIFLQIVYGSSVLSCGDYNIIYEWHVANDDTHSYASAFKFKEIELVHKDDGTPFLANFTIEIDSDEQDELFLNVWNETSHSEIFDMLPKMKDPEVLNDGKDDSLFEPYVIERDDGPSFKFFGKLIGEASSSYNNSGCNGRSEYYGLYKTKSGKYVCEKVGYTQWQGEHTRYFVKVCDDLLQVGQYFGFSWLAKELYKSAKVEIAIEIL